MFKLLITKLVIRMFIACRKFFETRHSLIGRDDVDIDKFKLVQVQRRVQRDGHNCSVLCLKVCMHVAYNYLYTINFMHNVQLYTHNSLIIMQIAEQLLNFNDISEDTILRADMRKACEEIGIALLVNSGILYH